MKPQIYSSRERHESLHSFVKQTWYNSSLEAEESSFECYLSASSAEFKVILHQSVESFNRSPAELGAKDTRRAAGERAVLCREQGHVLPNQPVKS